MIGHNKIEKGNFSQVLQKNHILEQMGHFCLLFGPK